MLGFGIGNAPHLKIVGRIRAATLESFGVIL
jgi:hypothetical protein